MPQAQTRRAEPRERNPLPEHLTAVDIVDRVRCSIVTLDRWIRQGRFPRPTLRAGGRRRLWLRSAVEAWLAEEAARAQATVKE